MGVTPKPAACACAHMYTVHTLTDRKPRRRTWCTAWDGAGKCGCTKYEAAAQ